MRYEKLPGKSATLHLMRSACKSVMKFGACAGSGESWSLGSVSSVLVFEGDGEPDQRRRPSPAIFMKKKKKKKVSVPGLLV